MFRGGGSPARTGSAETQPRPHAVSSSPLYARASTSCGFNAVRAASRRILPCCAVSFHAAQDTFAGQEVLPRSSFLFLCRSVMHTVALSIMKLFSVEVGARRGRAGPPCCDAWCACPC